MSGKLEKLARENDDTIVVDVSMYDTSRNLILDVKKEIESGTKKVRYSHSSLVDRDLIHSVFNRNWDFKYDGTYLVMEVRR